MIDVCLLNVSISTIDLYLAKFVTMFDFKKHVLANPSSLIDIQKQYSILL